jgi:hypothetical protein
MTNSSHSDKVICRCMSRLYLSLSQLFLLPFPSGLLIGLICSCSKMIDSLVLFSFLCSSTHASIILSAAYVYMLDFALRLTVMIISRRNEIRSVLIGMQAFSFSLSLSFNMSTSVNKKRNEPIERIFIKFLEN